MSRTASGGLTALFLGLVLGLICWGVSGLWWYGLMTGTAVAVLSAPALILLTRTVR